MRQQRQFALDPVDTREAICDWIRRKESVEVPESAEFTQQPIGGGADGNLLLVTWEVEEEAPKVPGPMRAVE